MYKKLRGCAPCAVAGALGSHTTLSARSLRPRGLQYPSNRISSPFNSIQPELLRYTTHIGPPDPRLLGPYVSDAVISSKIYLFRFIDAVVSLNLLWIKCNPYIFCL